MQSTPCLAKVVGRYESFVECVHQYVLQFPVVAHGDLGRELDRKHTLFHALNQPIFSLFDQLDVLPNVARVFACDFEICSYVQPSS